MEKLVSITAFSISLFATHASAEMALSKGQMRALYEGTGEHRYACFDVKNAAGLNAPILVLVTTESTVKGELKIQRNYNGVITSGKCLSVKGSERLMIEGAAIMEPVRVRVGSSRKALSAK